MSEAEVVVIGEALIDIIRRTDTPDVEYPGGSPANVALGLGRLGRRVRLLTALGDDVHGHALRDWLHESGVEVDEHRLDRTATAVARLGPDGSAEYDFDLTWELGADHRVGEPAVVHIGSLSALREPGAAHVRALIDRLPAGVLVTYDPNIRPSLIPPREESVPAVEAWVRRSQVVKVSDDDLAWLYPEEDPADVVVRWAQLGPRIVVLTRGSEGIQIVCGPDDVRTYPAPSVEVSDTVGAGDSLMGALVDAAIQTPVTDWDVDAVAERALRVAAITVSRPGADPPTRGDLA